MEFESPSSAYRPAPFWSWNDTLIDDELRWQVRELKRAGYGGFFMHPRVGLETEYLSDEWFDRIAACVDEARKARMEAWLYDEDKWPSGFAGGWMSRKYPETDGVFLNNQIIEPAGLADALADAKTVAVFAFRLDDGGQLRAFRRLADGDQLEKGETPHRYFYQPFDRSNWWNGETYLDLLNPDAVRQFLDLTMAGYNKRFQGDYGSVVPGIFTDEPNFRCWPREEEDRPWTPGFEELFRKRFGYDLLDHLPALTHPISGHEKARHDFWRLATERFVEAFSRPYGEMCAQLGLSLTGHWLHEDNLRVQTMHIGAAMPHYEFEQVPGIDHLCRNIEDALTLKQCASVAHQFGRERVLCEIFGVSGQDFTFQDAKWIGDFHFALGINYFCPHLTLYSFTGDRKRDYPPTFSYHQPYWDRMSLINDYFARVGVFTRQGQCHARILMLHPIASAWSVLARRDDCPEVDRYNRELVNLQNGLLARHRDFDYGDEIIMSRHGRIEKGQFRIASHGQYDMVVVPPSFTWSEETVALLEAFLDAGGKVLFVGETPRAVNAEPAENRWRAILGHANSACCSNDPDDWGRILDEACPRDVSVTDETGREIASVLYHHRTLGNKHYYFLCNTDRNQGYDAVIRLNAAGGVVLCDPATGRMRPVQAESDDEGVVLRRHFAPVGSLAILIDPAPAAAEPLVSPVEIKREPLANTWKHERCHPNTLVLDVCRWALNDDPLGDATPVWKLRHAAFDAAGLEEYRGIQPWVLTNKGITPTRSVDVRMEVEFESDLERPEACLVVELAENFEIQLNGVQIDTNTRDWHWDKRFRKMPITSLIRKGRNVLTLSTRYRLGVEIEDMFIIGDFATRPVSDTAYAITAEPDGLTIGDWVEQGYHFYAGNMTYRQSFNGSRQKGQRVAIRLKDPQGTLYEIRLNGQSAGVLGWQPWELDVTDLVRDGENELEIVVYGSLRNAFGPLHNDQYIHCGNNWWVGPEAFTDEAHWTDRYMFGRYGLTGGVEWITFR